MSNFLFNKPNGNHTKTQNRGTQLKNRGNRGKKHGIPQNKINREKNEGKTLMEAQSYQKTENKVTIRHPHTSIIILNVNGLNSQIKRHRVADWIKNLNPIWGTYLLMIPQTKI